MGRFEAPPPPSTLGLVFEVDASNPNSFLRRFPNNVRALIVGGGGGGGGRVSNGASGGGGGGGYQIKSINLTSQDYTVTVGAGGANGGITTTNGSNGGDSSFNSVTAYGGGGGGWSADGGAWNAGSVGASGGGGGGGDQNPNGLGGGPLPGQGSPGGSSLSSAGDCGGGGGGAGEKGDDFNGVSVSPNYFVAGGDGRQTSISGVATYYGGGGGAQTRNTSEQGPGGLGGGGGGGVSGTANTGGGGGGASNQVASPGNGGSGVVIIRYPGLPAATGGDINKVGRFTTHTFNSSGTFSPAKWNDLSGNNINGTLTNGPTFRKNRGWFDLDGANDFFDFGRPSEVENISDNITVEIWYREDTDGTYQVFSKYGGGANDGAGWEIFFNAGQSINFGGRNTTSKFYSVGTTKPTVGQWHQVVGQWQSTVLRLYIDGALAATTSSGVTAGTLVGTDNLRIGYKFGYFNGQVGLARIYNRILTEGEILNNFERNRGNFGI